MTYQAWTAKAVELRVLEAAETLMMSPNDNRGSGGSGWPEFIPDYPQRMKIRVRPSPGALSRMMQTWSFINALPCESDRRLLYSWAWMKTRRGRFLSDFAAREGIKSRTLRWTITRICQEIADRLNKEQVALSGERIDDIAEIAPEVASNNVASPNHASHWRDPAAKPFHQPDSPETKKLIKRLEDQNRRRRARANPA